MLYGNGSHLGSPARAQQGVRAPRAAAERRCALRLPRTGFTQRHHAKAARDELIGIEASNQEFPCRVAHFTQCTGRHAGIAQLACGCLNRAELFNREIAVDEIGDRVAVPAQLAGRKAAHAHLGRTVPCLAQLPRGPRGVLPFLDAKEDGVALLAVCEARVLDLSLPKLGGGDATTAQLRASGRRHMRACVGGSMRVRVGSPTRAACVPEPYHAGPLPNISPNLPNGAPPVAACHKGQRSWGARSKRGWHVHGEYATGRCARGMRVARRRRGLRWQHLLRRVSAVIGTDRLCFDVDSPSRPKRELRSGVALLLEALGRVARVLEGCHRRASHLQLY